MLYGAESWTLKLNDKRRINAFELWCWRRVLRIPWTAKVRNTEVIAIINPTSSLEALVLKQKMTYFGHVMRSKEVIGKSLMLGRVAFGSLFLAASRGVQTGCSSCADQPSYLYISQFSLFPIFSNLACFFYMHLQTLFLL